MNFRFNWAPSSTRAAGDMMKFLIEFVQHEIQQKKLSFLFQTPNFLKLVPGSIAWFFCKLMANKRRWY